VIDREWLDANGAPLVQGFRKRFRGGPSLRSAPDPKTWHLITPHAGTAEPLVVDFPHPMNYPLLQRMLRVSAVHSDVTGTVTIGRQEAEWRFTPRKAWTAGTYRLTVDTGLEDLAGNHVGQLFDIDIFERGTEQVSDQTIGIPFEIRPEH
jgi:hypothetical protein